MSRQNVDVARLAVENLNPRERMALFREWQPPQSDPLTSANDALLLKQADSGRLLGCSRHTIKRLVKDGALHPVQLRGATRYRRSELLALAGEGVAA